MLIYALEHSAVFDLDRLVGFYETLNGKSLWLPTVLWILVLFCIFSIRMGKIINHRLEKGTRESLSSCTRFATFRRRLQI